MHSYVSITVSGVFLGHIRGVLDITYLCGCFMNIILSGLMVQSIRKYVKVDHTIIIVIEAKILQVKV